MDDAPGVQAVLDQLLDDRGGPLDDLSSRDAIDEMIIQDADPTHQSLPSKRAILAWASTTGASTARRVGRRREITTEPIDI